MKKSNLKERIIKSIIKSAQRYELNLSNYDFSYIDELDFKFKLYKLHPKYVYTYMVTTIGEYYTCLIYLGFSYKKWLIKFRIKIRVNNNNDNKFRYERLDIQIPRLTRHCKADVWNVSKKLVNFITSKFTKLKGCYRYNFLETIIQCTDGLQHVPVINRIYKEFQHIVDRLNED